MTMEIEDPKQKKIEELNYDEDDDDFEEFEVEGKTIRLVYCLLQYSFHKVVPSQKKN